MRRLRQTLGWAIAAVVGIALLLADIGAVVFLRGMLERNLSAQIATAAQETATFYLRRGTLPPRLPMNEQIGVYSPSGQLLARTGPVPNSAPQPGFSTQSGQLGFAQPLPNGQIFFASTSMQPVNAPVRLLEDALIVLTLLALAIALFVAWRLARRIAQPLTDLAFVASRIAETGDLEEDLPQGGRIAEIAELSDALGRMLGTLRSTFQALEAAEARSRALREGTLHDLRTPLSTVLGALELMQGGQLGQGAAAEAAQLARREAKRMAARLEEGSEGGSATADLAAAVRRASRTHELAVSPAELIVAAPAQELFQVLSLLVDNAERHNPENTRIVLSVGSAEEYGWAEVADFGKGMAPEEADRAFERFYRGPDSQGLGLGLSLVRVLVESRGGRVQLDTAPHKGTKVRVFWPLSSEGT
ncbi:MAG: HAMP domain-containing sensor histidine kinase [Thermaerobacter sp.]|nr:HAMP domain-containing sensor histidine kinase [Thermaerobacter sp.]